MHRCDFCGKDQTQVKRMIINDSVAICNECVFICVDVYQNLKELIIKQGMKLKKMKYWRISNNGTSKGIFKLSK